MAIIFYSWQSDLSNNTNRTFIETALQRAVKELAQDPEIQESPRVDRDTSGVPGTPDIANAILEKIEAADVCVFDVSIVARNERRAFPNPNVLIELGYALRAHSSERIILVFNSATGKPREDLPFDLGLKRAMEYETPEGGHVDRSADRAALTKSFVAALKLIYAHTEANCFSKVEVEFFTALYDNARVFLNLRAELGDRTLRPYSEMLRSECGSIANSLRDLAALDVASDRRELLAHQEALCTELDRIAAWRPAMGGSHVKFVALMDAAAKEASELLDLASDPVRQALLGTDCESAKRQLVRQARGDLARLQAAVKDKDASHLRTIRESLEGRGLEMLRLAADLEVLGDSDSKDLRSAGHVLHVAAIERSQEVGFLEEQQLIDRLTPLLSPLSRLV